MAEISLWEQTNPRNYKFQILDFRHQMIDVRVVGSLTWRQLDGKQLIFPNAYRPRARYLYFSYCVGLLKVAWRKGEYAKAFPFMKGEVGNPCWGTKGRYLPRNQLAAFVEELGHEYDEILEGADDALNDEGDDDVLLSAITRQIKAKSREEESESDEDEDDEEDDEW